MFNRNPGYPPNPSYPQYGNNFRGQIPNYNQFVPSTNKTFVRSLEEALSLPADFNSQNVYFDVNEDIMYDICTNGRGEKSWSILKISMAQNSNNAVPVPNSPDLFEKRIGALESGFKRLEELLNGKCNAESTDTTNE